MYSYLKFYDKAMNYIQCTFKFEKGQMVKIHTPLISKKIKT